jgi:hypothetical protein
MAFLRNSKFQLHRNTLTLTAVVDQEPQSPLLLSSTIVALKEAQHERKRARR